MMRPWDDLCEIMNRKIPKAFLFGNNSLKGHKNHIILSWLDTLGKRTANKILPFANKNHKNLVSS